MTAQRGLRITRIDENGNPVGPSTWVPGSVEVVGSDAISTEWVQECVTEEFVQRRDASFEFTFTTALDPLTYYRILKSWGGMTPRMVRHRRYLTRTHGHAPKRRNKHGRVGVSRRR